MGTIPLFPSAFSCLFVGISPSMSEDEVPKFSVFSMNGCGKVPSTVIFFGFCAWWYLMRIWLFVNTNCLMDYGTPEFHVVVVVAVYRCRED